MRSHLLHVDLEGSLGLALGAGARLHLLVLGLEEGPQNEVALVAVVLDHAELRQDPRAAADHAAGPDQLVQVKLPERPDLLHQRQVADPDVDLVSDAVVFRVHGENDFFGCFVKNLTGNRK